MNINALKMTLDGKDIPLVARLHNPGEVLVPLHEFCAAIGAEAKQLDGTGPLAVCKEDLCIPLNVGGRRDTVTVEEVVYASLAAFGDALGLTWDFEHDVLRVHTSDREARAGLGIGERPPAFTLPDLYTGEPVRISDYAGKRVVFYMWASW